MPPFHTFRRGGQLGQVCAADPEALERDDDDSQRLLRLRCHALIPGLCGTLNVTGKFLRKPRGYVFMSLESERRGVSNTAIDRG